MPIDKEASRIWRDRIRDVLNQQWDPIGGCPPDEYDSYIDPIAGMLRDNATDDAIMRYLEWAVSVNMGLGRFAAANARDVIKSLRALGPPN
jgi:hypothetical protein